MHLRLHMALRALLGSDSKLPARDEGKASGDISDESNQDCTNSSSDSDPRMRHWNLAV